MAIAMYWLLWIILLASLEMLLTIDALTVALSPAGIITLSTTQGEATAFTCTVTSKPRDDFNFTWERVSASTGTAILGRETVFGGSTQVISSLSYTPQKEHNGDKIRCSAINTIMTSPVVSHGVTLIIQYPPDYVNNISGYSNPVTESSTESLHLACSVNGVPNPNTLNYTWSSSCGTGARNGSEISVPRNRTMNNKQCFCTVTHSVTGWSQPSPPVKFKITYAPNVTLRVSSADVTEGGSTQLECLTSAVPDISTYINWTQHVNGVKVREFPGSKSLNISNLTFENSGEYKCTAKNIIGRGSGSGSVAIKYASKLVEAGNFSAGINDTATLSLKFIGDPQPNVTWYKDGSNSSLDSNSTKFVYTFVATNVTWKFYGTPVIISGYEATLIIHSVQQQDYAAYHAILDNGLNTESQIPKFYAHLLPNDKPEHPSDFVAVCSVSTVLISWTSQFNGGLIQTFHLTYVNGGHDVTLSEQDPGKGNTGTIELNSLAAEKNYTFHIFATNTLGNSETLNTSCQTKQNMVSTHTQEPVDDINEIAIAAGVAVPLAIIIAVVTVVVIVMLRKRKISKANTRDSSEMNVGSSNTVNDSTGFTDIPLDTGAYGEISDICNITVNITNQQNNNIVGDISEMNVGSSNTLNDNTDFTDIPLDAGSYVGITDLRDITVNLTNQQNNNIVGPVCADADKSKKNKKPVHPGPLHADVDKSQKDQKIVDAGFDCEYVPMTGIDSTVNTDTSNESYESAANEDQKQNTKAEDDEYADVEELKQKIQDKLPQAPPPPPHPQGMIYADLVLVDVKERTPHQAPLKRYEEETAYASIDYLGTANHVTNLHLP